MYRYDILRERMRAAGIRVSDIEKKTGISRHTIKKIVTGDPNGRFELYRLRDIAGVIGVDLSDLFTVQPSKQTVKPEPAVVS
jgi:transcriptional regulator with XRE-family HTH domain